MDYFDILLAKKLSGGGGGEITVEGLNVEENGTYTAPSGKAYSPVVVNLPLDEKTITANGEYLASADDLKGFSKVTVNVAGFSKKAMPTGAISSFNDGTANPLTKLKIAINPVQAGSGDPSPSNPRPISGWTGANVNVSGKNIISNASKEQTSSSVARWYYSNGFWLRKNVTYTLSATDESTVYIDNKATGTNIVNGAKYKTYTPSDDVLVYFRCYNASGIENTKLMLEVNAQMTAYEDYVGSVVPVSWQTEAGTVYGGYFDWKNWKVVATHANIASYNGESINEPWISSIDKYEEGATPTTGAQVVYPLTTPIEYTLSSVPNIRSILGTNNVWVDTGEITEGEYFVAL